MATWRHEQAVWLSVVGGAIAGGVLLWRYFITDKSSGPDIHVLTDSATQTTESLEPFVVVTPKRRKLLSPAISQPGSFEPNTPNKKIDVMSPTRSRMVSVGEGELDSSNVSSLRRSSSATVEDVMEDVMLVEGSESPSFSPSGKLFKINNRLSMSSPPPAPPSTPTLKPKKRDSRGSFGGQLRRAAQTAFRPPAPPPTPSTPDSVTPTLTPGGTRKKKVFSFGKVSDEIEVMGSFKEPDEEYEDDFEKEG